MKPILFNTDMVKKILLDQKTATRRVVKPQPADDAEIVTSPAPWYGFESDTDMWHIKPPYRPGDILYVPQPWKCYAIWDDMEYEVEFQDGEFVKFEFSDLERAKKWAKYLDKPEHQWQSPYFMPREAARIFLRVTDVRVERLQDINDDGVIEEGLEIGAPFDELWDSTIKSKDRDVYGWNANPWVWVIELERISKEEAITNE